MNSELLVNGLMFIMILGSLFLAVVSYIPRFPKMVAPTWSTHFFATVIVVIASKVITLYAVLYWYLTARAGTEHAFFIWGYFLCMWFGIFVYFHFGSSERERANTVKLLESTPLALIVSLGILLYYSFSTVTSYGYWQAQPDKEVFLHIALISAVDFFFFAVLWLHYWLTRPRVIAQAQDYDAR
jgi:hypothetical protein